jgi:tRNA A37 methylthiotransferase MiaB
VLIEGHAKRGNDVMFGYTSNHYKVLFNANEEDIGRIVNVKIKDYTTTVLIGEIV